MLTNQEIGTYLKKRRMRLGLNQLEMAKQLDIAAATLNKFEKGKRNIGMKFLGKIAKGYQIPLGIATDLIIHGKNINEEDTDLVPLFKRITEAKIEKFLYSDLQSLLSFEKEFGFELDPSQLKCWYQQRTKTF